MQTPSPSTLRGALDANKPPHSSVLWSGQCLHPGGGTAVPTLTPTPLPPPPVEPAVLRTLQPAEVTAVRVPSCVVLGVRLTGQGAWAARGADVPTLVLTALLLPGLPQWHPSPAGGGLLPRSAAPG